MKHIFKAIFFSFILLLFACKNENKNSNTKKEIVDDYSTKLDSLIETKNPRKFNGVILITKNGKTVYSKAQGYSDFENKKTISLNDNFRIQSNSKQITAVLILKEVEKGTIHLESPIKKYLPNLKQDWVDKVTVHQLLNMSSGIVDLEKPLIFEAGKGYRYSNPAYALLGRILERSTGKSFTELVNEEFKTLGMKNSYAYNFKGLNNKLINGHWLENDEIIQVQFYSLGFFTKETWKDFIPAGGMISNVKDLSIWDTKLHNGKILSPKYYNKMIDPTNRGPHASFDNDTIGYAYGLRVHDKHPKKHLGHGGRGLGFANIKIYIPDSDVNVIVLENIYCLDDNSKYVYYYENEIRKLIFK